jgi:hypothetical protein
MSKIKRRKSYDRQVGRKSRITSRQEHQASQVFHIFVFHAQMQNSISDYVDRALVSHQKVWRSRSKTRAFWRNRSFFSMATDLKCRSAADLQTAEHGFC